MRSVDDVGDGAYNFSTGRRFRERGRLRPRAADGIVGRLARIKQKRDVPIEEDLRDRRRRLAAQPQVQHCSGKLFLARKFERLLKRQRGSDDRCARLFEARLDIQCDNEFIFDNEYAGAGKTGAGRGSPTRALIRTAL